MSPPLPDPTGTGQTPGLLARLRAARLARRLRRARSRLGRFRQVASRFLYVPPHLHLADPSIAGDFLAGQIVLGGRSLLTAGRSPLDMALPGKTFSLAFHGFDWLRHFEANGAAEVRAGARSLVIQWMARREAGHLPDAELPQAVTRRIVNWVTHSALLAENADHAGYRRLMAHVGRDAAMVRVIARTSGIGMIRLDAAIAYLFQALALDHRRGILAEAEGLLLLALGECLAEDGTPRDRSAGTAVELAANLIPVLALYRARQRAVPDLLSPALLRLISFIRMMQHPDGGLALFNGSGRVTRDLVAQVLQFGMGQSLRIESAPDAGFERMEDEHGLVIADAGALPKPGFGSEAGAGALAFEFSTKSDRLIVNCGIPHAAEGEAAASYRQASAHSTVLIDDEPLVRLAWNANALLGPVREPVSEGPFSVPRLESGPGGTALVLGHDGFLAAKSIRIERRLTLLANGGGLLGLDRFEDARDEAPSHRLTLAFHLHPRVMPVPLSRRDAVVLRLQHQAPGRDMWLFEVPGVPLQIEASRCYEQDFASPETEVIVVEVVVAGNTEIAWRLIPYRG